MPLIISVVEFVFVSQTDPMVNGKYFGKYSC